MSKKKVEFTKGHRYSENGVTLAPMAVKGDVRELADELADTLVSQEVATLVDAPKAEAKADADEVAKAKAAKAKADKAKKKADADKSAKPGDDKKDADKE